MAETEATAPEGRSASAHQAMRAMARFTSEIKRFRDDIHNKMQQQEERLTMLDRKSIAGARPVLSAAAETDLSHKAAFGAYLRNGDDDGLRGLETESKALSSAVAGDGGYLVDPQTSETVQSVLHSTASLRQVANVVRVEATSYDVLIDTTDVGAGWSSETGAQTETGTPQLDRIVIPLHELSALPKASQRLLDDAAFDIESWLAGRIADKFARAEAAAFVTGDGADKPTGFLTHPTVDDTIWEWGNLGYVPTGAAGAFQDADPLVELVYALGAQYRAGASFVMNSKTAGTVRKMKDGDGRFLWSDGLAAGEPARLLGYPVLIAEDMPDIAADSFAVAFGDFGQGYTIAERPDLRILRDPFSAKPHVLFYATKRVGGDVSDFAAIKLLKFAAE
ncbi:phage major capsid protein, HK97 family [Tranquillimonas rosea]|uniref:Phage major capsid protein, HK97 family n=1 Tax=Tranquillimonas rosea TaxID=641238 RepID=A0A1H9TDM0_9RHOB|nr:phage major capsid protein, HK97 family [Tranquillimonas rosea]